MVKSNRHTKKHTRKACSCRRKPMRRNTGATISLKDLKIRATKKKTATRHRKHRRSSMKNMLGGFVACNDKVITEPGFNVPVFGKAPGLSIPDTKVALGSSDVVKVDHPMVQ